MNPGICYVYEYDNNQRKRNVGFLKIARHYQSCILQIHVRGLPVGNGTTLELCAFYLSGGDLIGVPVASLTCFSRSISVRLPISESHFPEQRPLSGIDGFLIRLPGGRDSVFWAASEKNFDADPAHMLLPEDRKAETPADTGAEIPAGEERPEEITPKKEEEPALTPENTPAGKNDNSQKDFLPQGKEVPLKEELSQDEPFRQERELLPEEAATQDEPVAQDEKLSRELSSSAEAPLPHETPDAPGSKADQTTGKPEESASPMQAAEQDSRIPVQTPHSPSARKIQRSDISKLPRRFWFLANNSFLLHGCHNYNHLLLVEEDGHVWLGVPGIYDVREARAADLFGFPQFTRSYAPLLGLSEDERNDEADFGHWCRYLDSDGSSK